MAIIVIGQQLGSRGLVLGQLTAKQLGYRFFASSDVLAIAARRYNLTPEQLQLIDERLPHFWERLRTDSERLYASFRATLLKELGDDAAVAVGRSASPLFMPVEAGHVLRVRTIAPLEARVRQVADDERLEPEAAERRVREYDREMRERLKTMLGVDVDDPTLYHLVLNTGALPIETLADLLADCAHHAERAAGEDSRDRLRDASLTAQVRAALLAHPKIGHARINVRTVDRVVTLTSAALVPPWDDLVNRVVSQIEGVRSVELAVEGPPIPPRAD